MNKTPIRLYGIPNCDTVKRARTWLDTRGVAYEFHDFKKLGVPADALAGWVNALGWEPLLNRKGTTWRKLEANVQAQATNAAGAQAVMVANPSVIKRPVVDWGGQQFTVGFDPAAWERLRAA